jgi:hypothetical protein
VVRAVLANGEDKQGAYLMLIRWPEPISVEGRL